MLNALTIDLEDWYHPELVRGHLPVEHQDGKIKESTGPLLDLLQDRGVKATFFVVGEVAQRHPDLVQAIARAGHELACHGQSHRPLWDMTPDELRGELSAFSRTMEAILPGLRARGFRAPTFSLDNRSRWALDILADLDYRYDSSIFPVRTPLYGVSGCPLGPYRPSPDNVAHASVEGRLVEFPMSVCTCGGLRVPVCGGFYLRALPFRLLRHCLRQINTRRPFVIYVHPWETDPETTRLALPLMARFVTYHNIGAVRRRLEMLLDEFAFAPMRVVLETIGELRK
jgi:polysaccharide deacetylase family protein (PEP-CTERM system associated)